METWTATVRVGTRTVDVIVDETGDLDPDLLDLMREEAVVRGTVVDLTATGPPVSLSTTDAGATIAWIRDRFDVLEETTSPGWPDDPRTSVPDDALA